MSPPTQLSKCNKIIEKINPELTKMVDLQQFTELYLLEVVAHHLKKVQRVG